MKITDLFPENGLNLKAAKKIIIKAKRKSKKQNPDETETPTGWEADPHQGSFDKMRMTR